MFLSMHFCEEKQIFFGNVIQNQKNFCEQLLEKGFAFLVEDSMNFNYSYDVKL